VNHTVALNSVQTTPSFLSCRLRHAHELLFSLNLALVLKLEGNQKPNRLFSFLDFGEVSLQFKINGYLHLHPHHAVGANTAFLILALGPALLIFLVLRVLSRATIIEHLFRSAAGIVSLTALPIAWLVVTYVLGVDSPIRVTTSLFYLELCAVVLCAVLYVTAKWPAPKWLSFLLTALHFAFWSGVVSGPYFWLAPFSVIFPAAGFFATVCWAAYIRCPEEATS
jgi:hypothetical protein